MLALFLLATGLLAQGVLAQSFYSYWSEGGGNFRCNNGPGGSYTAEWSGNGGFVCGKGWSPGGPRFVWSPPSLAPMRRQPPPPPSATNDYRLTDT